MMKIYPALVIILLAAPALSGHAGEVKKSAAVVRTEKEMVREVADGPAQVETKGRSIMRLSDDVVIQGRPCKRGWLRLHPNGVPSSFTLSRELRIGSLQIPADTWVQQNEKGVVVLCAFPADTEVQGLVCRGTGGAKGVQVELHPSGTLKKMFLARDTYIQGVPCAANMFSGMVEFYENGRLKSCKLSDAYTFDGVAYKKGARVEFPAPELRPIAAN
ncbi:MAG: hypothetical protein QM790_13850 [Nibricoccus sp.]